MKARSCLGGRKATSLLPCNRQRPSGCLLAASRHSHLGRQSVLARHDRTVIRPYTAVASLAPVTEASIASEGGQMRRLKKMQTLLSAENYDGVVHEFKRAAHRGNVSEDFFGVVLEACSRLGDLETAMRLLETMKLKGIPLSTDVYTTLLKAAAKGPNAVERVVRLLTILEKEAGDGSSLTENSYLVVAKTLLMSNERRYVKAALTVLERLQGKVDSTKILGLEILALGNLDEVEELSSRISSAPDSVISCDFWAYCTIALHRCTSVKDRHEKCVSAYSALLHAIDAQAKEHTFFDPERQDLIVMATRAVFDSIQTEGKLAEALTIRRQGQAVFRTMLITQRQRDQLYKELDSGTLRVLRAALIESLTRREAATSRRTLHQEWTTIVDNMRYRRVLQDADACYVVLDLHILASKDGLSSMENATQLFEDMKKEGLRPNREIYNLLMQGWASMESLDSEHRLRQVLQIFEALRRAGHIPDVGSYTALFTACAPLNEEMTRDVTSGQAAAVLEYELQMLREGVVHDAKSTHAIIDALLGLGQYEEATQRFVDMRLTGIPRDLELYNTMIWRCSLESSGRAALFAVKDLWYTMQREEHITPDPRTFEGLIRCCQRQGDVVSALRLVEDMGVRGITPDIMIYQIVLDMMEPWGDLVACERTTILKCIAQNGKV
ncbi:pentatricopeptide repeat domain-containing protein [Spizellomyces punctatus DAOM BR117]|uniref:Pentatricopeptide repeat domain-containing protein n=1 Tax=Spizellomyces punctatus (strain DAOM BR117) TaxID=645134 RepID=A0A0L0HP74_SPIPD|nr:pentatricopeptide repeat domain-containing protein [Spizellomyces punctatus DAOM BR117]KND02897.1 pentatricopeptide repeat domain-containing protein [Spizellomyces punctatus DAOM BR117]|eukprot:XP_016610936.1 pentatricopeptide repeat domain-containing protein [Spizellomyces punctatus DAOM BR117]